MVGKREKDKQKKTAKGSEKRKKFFGTDRLVEEGYKMECLEKQ